MNVSLASSPRTDAPQITATQPFDSVVARMIPIDRLMAAKDELRTQFQAGKPYPHVVIDNFFDPEILRRLIADFPSQGGRDWIQYDTENEIKTTSRGIADLSLFTQAFFLQICAEPMMDWLRYVTGHADLVPDPLFHGGGLHESPRGGWLNVHVDWTQHPVLPLARRLNLIIYLNEGWDPAWGGALDLVDHVSKKAGASVSPLFNRAVIFETNDETLHGFPDPMTCPVDITRKSVSLFYWSPDPEAIKKASFITFLPGKKHTRLKAIARSFVPPITYVARDKLAALVRSRLRRNRTA